MANQPNEQPASQSNFTRKLWSCHCHVILAPWVCLCASERSVEYRVCVCVCVSVLHTNFYINTHNSPQCIYFIATHRRDIYESRWCEYEWVSERVCVCVLHTHIGDIYSNEVCCSHIFKSYTVVCRAVCIAAVAATSAKPTHGRAHTHISNWNTICLKIPTASLPQIEIIAVACLCAHASKCMFVSMLPQQCSMYEKVWFFSSVQLYGVLFSAFLFRSKKSVFASRSFVHVLCNHTDISMNVLFQYLSRLNIVFFSSFVFVFFFIKSFWLDD